MESNIKVYPFENAVFIKRFTTKTIIPNYANKVKTAYSKSGKDRVFFRRIFIFAAPSCIYGYISECNKQTRIEYTIDKTESIHIFKIFGMSMCCIIGFMCLIDAFYSGIKIQTFISLILIFLIIVLLYFLMNIPQSEEDALHRFMEELGL